MAFMILLVHVVFIVIGVVFGFVLCGILKTIGLEVIFLHRLGSGKAGRDRRGKRQLMKC